MKFSDEKMNRSDIRKGNDLSGQVAVVTGAASGTGLPFIGAHSAGIIRESPGRFGDRVARCICNIASDRIDTPVFHRATNTYPQRLSNITGRIPARSAGNSKDVGLCAAFLHSDAAHHISGSRIPVDGGARIGG